MANPPPSDDAIDALEAVVAALSSRRDRIDPEVLNGAWRRLREMIAERARSLGQRDAA